MNMREQEKRLIEKIDKHGLVRVVAHDIFDMPMHPDAFGKGHPAYIDEDDVAHIIGVTEVRLYEKEVWSAKRKARTTDEREGYVALGRTYCSEKEKHYSRQRGRLIATGRAFKAFEASLV